MGELRPDLAVLGYTEPIPTVDPGDLRGMYEFIRKTLREAAPNSTTVEAPERHSIGIDVHLLAKECSPGANVFAAWLRSSLLEMLLQQGLLVQWLHGNDLDGRVFQAAASFPIASIGRFDPEGFLEQLRKL